jgi:hypothetical protein
VLRGIWPDRNPLRRHLDRVEAALLAAVIAIFLVGAPIAAFAAGQWAGHGAAATARAERAAWHPVRAVILHGVPRPSDNPYGAVYLVHVPARWTAQDGAVRTGTVTAAAGTPVGAAVTIWTSVRGVPTGPPLNAGQISRQAVLTGLLAVLCLAVLLTVSAFVIRRLLNRRRMAAWDAEWSATGPQWCNYR